jgi:hypothetical protein
MNPRIVMLLCTLQYSCRLYRTWQFSLTERAVCGNPHILVLDKFHAGILFTPDLAILFPLPEMAHLAGMALVEYNHFLGHFRSPLHELLLSVYAISLHQS